MRREGSGYIGVEAVIDKDFASALLANQLGVEDFAICTAVDAVSLNYNTPEQVDLHELTIEEAEKYLAEGSSARARWRRRFRRPSTSSAMAAAGSVITSLEKLRDAVDGKAGTVITR